MRKIYVAHPYGGKEENKSSVEKIIKELARKNPTVLYISPIHATGFLYSDVTYEQGMEYCYELLKSCDELLLCEGWENSKGCNFEKEYADLHKIPFKEHKKNKCAHIGENGKHTVAYCNSYEMRSSDMYCTQCGKEESREELTFMQKRG